jgi:hypothetical protein
MLTVNARRSLFLVISLVVILLDRVAKIAAPWTCTPAPP